MAFSGCANLIVWYCPVLCSSFSLGGGFGMCSESFLSRSVLYWATIPQAFQSFLEVRSERLLGENKSGRCSPRYLAWPGSVCNPYKCLPAWMTSGSGGAPQEGTLKSLQSWTWIYPKKYWAGRGVYRLGQWLIRTFRVVKRGIINKGHRTWHLKRQLSTDTPTGTYFWPGNCFFWKAQAHSSQTCCWKEHRTPIPVLPQKYQCSAVPEDPRDVNESVLPSLSGPNPFRFCFNNPCISSAGVAEMPSLA